jgi:flagellar basal-body rod modification protein FlgD
MVAAASTLPASVVTLPAGTQLPNSASSASSTLSETDFLTLLTTQLEKQDPLNPQNPSDLAAELAQFSTASGIQNVNATLNSSSGLQAAGLVGHNVAVPGNSLVLGQSGSATGAVQLSGAATDVTVRVINTQSQVVASIDLGAMPAGNQTFTWNGQGSNGKTLAAGTYSFSVSATGAQGASVTATPYAVAPVTSVSFSGTNGPMLTLGNGLSPTALSAVQQIF